MLVVGLWGVVCPLCFPSLLAFSTRICKSLEFEGLRIFRDLPGLDCLQTFQASTGFKGGAWAPLLLLLLLLLYYYYYYYHYYYYYYYY